MTKQLYQIVVRDTQNKTILNDMEHAFFTREEAETYIQQDKKRLTQEMRQHPLYEIREIPAEDTRKLFQAVADNGTTSVNQWYMRISAEEEVQRLRKQDDSKKWSVKEIER